jgi:hypothetical protein
MLDRSAKNSGLDDIFEEHFGKDRVRVFKPDPQTDNMAMNVFKFKSKNAFAAGSNYSVWALSTA